MSSFYDVTAGNATLAADINQYADRLNGTVASVLTIVATANNVEAGDFILPSAPSGSDQPVVRSYVTGDTVPRVDLYVRSSDGYGGIQGGAGPSITAHLYAQSSGWKIDEQLTVTGQINANGGISAASLNASGNVQGAAVYDNGNRVVIQGAHSSGQPIISSGSGVPGSLGTNEIFIQLS